MKKAVHRVWTVPVVLLVSSVAGLLVGLAADGAADVLAAVLLTAPLLVLAWHVRRA